MKIKKICFAASSGGHLQEIARLKALTEKYECFLFTEKDKFMSDDFCDKKYYIRKIDRRMHGFIFLYIWAYLVSFYVFLRERPDCIISTGALVTYPMCLIGKLMRKKIIYIESMARVESLSMTGRYMKKIADLYIVQWEELLKLVPGAVYGESIFE